MRTRPKNGTLREVFVQAMDEHIPKYQFTPRKPWTSQSTLDLITRRGVLRNLGDLQQVAEYNKEIKCSANRDKKNWLEEQLQSNSWEPIKQLTKSFPTKMVRLEPSPSLGISATATNADIYAAHLEQVQWAPATSSGVEDLCTDLLPHAAPDIEEGPVTMAELIQAIKHLKSGKSAGQDNIPNEFWKNLSGKGSEALLDLFQDCWSHGKSPSSWKQSQVIGIFKKGCESNPSNFRPISLLQTCYKLYARVLRGCMQVWTLCSVTISSVLGKVGVRATLFFLYDACKTLLMQSAIKFCTCCFWTGVRPLIRSNQLHYTWHCVG